MGIREQLLSIGYTNEKIDKMAQQEYNNRVELLPQKKSFFDTKIGKFLSTDWEQYFFDKIALTIYEHQKRKEEQINKEPIPTLETHTAWEVYQYNATHNIMPKTTIDHGNGCYTHIYESGLIVNVDVRRSGFHIPKEDIDNYKNFQKELLADYLNIPVEEILKMTEDEIQQLVLQNELSKKKMKRKILIPQIKKESR